MIGKSVQKVAGPRKHTEADTSAQATDWFAASLSTCPASALAQGKRSLQKFKLSTWFRSWTLWNRQFAFVTLTVRMSKRKRSDRQGNAESVLVKAAHSVSSPHSRKFDASGVQPVYKHRAVRCNSALNGVSYDIKSSAKDPDLQKIIAYYVITTWPANSTRQVTCRRSIAPSVTVCRLWIQGLGRSGKEQEQGRRYENIHQAIVHGKAGGTPNSCG